MPLGPNTRMDLLLKASLAILTVLTKKKQLIWRKGSACTVINFETNVDTEELGLPEELGKAVHLSVEFAEFACFGSRNRKVERFRLSVVVSGAHEIINLQSEVGTYDLFAQLFRAACDSVVAGTGSKNIPLSVEKLDWSDIADRQWQISRAEIRQLAEDAFKNKREDVERLINQRTTELRLRYEHEGFTVTD